MTKPSSCAVAQMCPVAGNIQRNLQEHVELAELAAKNGAQVVVFPELSLTGYELELATDLAFAEDDARLAPLREVAASYNVTLIAGAPIRLGTSLHIGAFIARPDGTFAWYAKQRLGRFPQSSACDSLDGVSLPPAEASVFAPGNRDALVRLGDRSAALAVCADIGSPAHAQRAADQGAYAYLASMFVIPSELDGEVQRLSSYAAQHRMLTCMANFGSPSGGLRSAGRSSIWSGTGELLVQLDAEGSGIALVTESADRLTCRSFAK